MSTSPYSLLQSRSLRTVEVAPSWVAVLAGDRELGQCHRRGLRRFVHKQISSLPAVPAVEDDGDLPPNDQLMSTEDML